MPRVGPKPLVASGMLTAAGGVAWLAQLGPHTGYAAGVLGPLILAALGLGLVIAPSINTGTFGVAPQDAGVASATVTVGQQLGASIGTSLLNTIFAAAVTSYLTVHLASARLIGRQALTGLALAHGYDTAFWWIAGIFAAGAVIGGALFRRGPLVPDGHAVPGTGRVTTAQAGTDPPSGVIRRSSKCLTANSAHYHPGDRARVCCGRLRGAAVRGPAGLRRSGRRHRAWRRSCAGAWRLCSPRRTVRLRSAGLDRFVGRYRSTLSSPGLSSWASGTRCSSGSRRSPA